MKRRFKILWVSVDAMLEYFGNNKEYVPPECVPCGVKAVSAFYDPFRQCFGIVMWHPNFPELSEAEVIPDFREG